MFGHEWNDGDYHIYWYENNDGERLATNLPNEKKNGKDYYFTISGYGNNLIFGYEDQVNASDKFDAYEIVDVVYSDKSWCILVYCYSNDQTYVM